MENSGLGKGLKFSEQRQRIQRTIKAVVYGQVQMPQNYIGGGEASGLKTNLDVITGFGAWGLMDQTQKVVK